MLSETLENALGTYEIGEKVRLLRKKRRLKLSELSNHTGLSTGMLSKIERNKLVPTLPTLMRIALVFSVGLDYFFSATDERHAFSVTRKEDRIAMPASSTKGPPYMFESLDYEAIEPRFHSWLATFQPAPKKIRSHQHTGFEFLYVIEGTLCLTWQDKQTVLRAGDSAYFRSDTPHSYERVGDETCRGIVVTTI